MGTSGFRWWRRQVQKPNFETNTLGCYIRETVIVLLEIEKNFKAPIKLDYYTTKDQHLQFKSDSPHPIRQPMSPSLQKVYDTLFTCFDKYMAFICAQEKKYKGNFYTSYLSKESGTHPNHDARIMLAMMTYLNKPVPDNFSEAIDHLYGLFAQLINKESEHSLYMFVNEHFQKEFQFGKRIQEMYVNN